MYIAPLLKVKIMEDVKMLNYIKEHYSGFRGHVFLIRRLNENEVRKYKSLIVDYEIVDKREEDKLIYGD